MAPLPNTICTLLTPPGRGAVAVIALRGPAAERVLGTHFCPASGKPFSYASGRDVVYGIWTATREDVVVVKRDAEHFEIHCHGGNVASDSIINSLESANIQNVPSHSFALDFNGLWKVEIELALSQTTTDRTAKILLHQLVRLPAKIEDLRRQIAAYQLESAIHEIDRMLAWSEFGQFLSEPRSVVLCGQPNVGKSSLVNAMVGYQRAIVHDAPGTTRDVVSQRTAFNGWPVELKDTAGLREHPATPIEAVGVEKAKSQIKSAQLLIAVFDHASAWTQADHDLITLVKPDLVVFNKNDLVPAEKKPAEHPPLHNPPPGIATSTQTNDGIPQLIEQIGHQLVRDFPDSSQSFPINPEQTGRLVNSRAHLHQSRQSEALEALNSPGTKIGVQ